MSYLLLERDHWERKATLILEFPTTWPQERCNRLIRTLPLVPIHGLLHRLGSTTIIQQRLTTMDATFWLLSKSMIARLIDLISNSMDKYV